MFSSSSGSWVLSLFDFDVVDFRPAISHRVPVCHLLSGTVSHDATFSRLRNVVEELDGVGLTPVDIQQVDGIVFSRLNEQYRPFIELSKLFLGHSGVSPQQSNFETFTFVIPMEKLFESFVASLLAAEGGILPGAQVKVQHSIGTLASTTSGDGLFEMTPDILVEKGGKRFIIDTKYKQIAKASDIQEADIYQMYAYATQYEADGVLLLYPDFGSGLEEEPIHLELKEFKVSFFFGSKGPKNPWSN